MKDKAKKLLREVNDIKDFNNESNRKSIVEIFKQVKSLYIESNLKSQLNATHEVETDVVKKIQYGRTHMKDHIEDAKKYMKMFLDEIISNS